MRSRHFSVIAFLLPIYLPGSAWGQWLTGASGSIYYNTGNVGIGTTAPSYTLDVTTSSPGAIGVHGNNTGLVYQDIYNLNSGTGGNGVDLRLVTENAAGNGLAIVDILKYANGLFTINNSETAGSAVTSFSVGGAERLRITSSGSVGIGTSSPGASLDIAGTSISALRINGTTGNNSSNNTQFRFAGGTQGDLWALGTDLTTNNGSKQFQFYDLKSNIVPLTLQQGTGNVGIGTTNPQHLLHVAGTIGAEEVIVSSTGADYVFEPGYHLKPLTEVDDYIRQNRHLPDIPSASEMQQKGAGVGEMQSKLLAKIEELTLHMIQEHERNDRLEQQNRDLQERIARLEAK